MQSKQVDSEQLRARLHTKITSNQPTPHANHMHRLIIIIQLFSNLKTRNSYLIN